VFGRTYFGGQYFGPGYFGGGSDTAAPGASAAQIWAYVLPNGLTAGQNVVGIYSMLQTLLGAPCPSADDNAAAVLAALSGTEIPVNVLKMNSAPVIGTGAEADPWRGVGVSP
jgi:hypothetical protein